MKSKVGKPDKPKPKNGNGKHVKRPRTRRDDLLEQLHRAGKML